MTRRELDRNWQVQSAFLATQSGEEVSQPEASTTGWHPAEMPCTVLCALVRDGTYPDPRIWPNPLRIPDSSDVFNEAHDLARYSHLPGGRNPWRDPWWLRTEFDLPAPVTGQRVWLNFDALNYRAEVWVNGVQIADREQLAGMFQRFRLDVTEQVQEGPNALAVLVYPVDHPGDPDTQLEVFGPVRNFHKDICNDVTEVMTIGYDCFPTVPDRNMGLVQEVYLETTGPVDLRHLFVRCDLDLPELNPARLTVSAELLNTSTRAVRGVLEGVVLDPQGRKIATFTRLVTLLSHETRLVTVSATDAPELSLADPQLWWPNTYGDQPLYTLALTFTPKDAPATTIGTTFGIRRLDRELHEVDGAHGFRLYVNGRRIFQRGGYVQPEMMFDWNRERVAAELRYFVHANLNYVTFEDIPNPPDWYLDLCDRYGLLFWNCYYDCYWLQYNRPWDIDTALLEDCTVDIAKRYRNHPSLIINMAQNEGETREDVYEMWRRTMLAYDDTRFLIPSGSFPWYRTDTPPWFDRELPVGCNDYMPKTYSWQLPVAYYTLVRDYRNWMFMIESGSASLPPVESLVRFMPHLRDLGPNPGDDPAWPLDAAWAHFGANFYYEWFDRGLRLMYGEPRDLTDYVWKAHLTTYDQHRGLFEAVHHRMWDLTSGFGEWKINSAFPDIQWQLYDWFLRPMVSLYAIRRACAELAVQLSPMDGTVSVINNRPEVLWGLTVQAQIYDLDMNVLYNCTVSCDAVADGYTEVFTLSLPEDADAVPVYFVKLRLYAAEGELLADNFYWLSPRLDDYETLNNLENYLQFPASKPAFVPRNTPCLGELADLPPVALLFDAKRDGGRVTVRVENPTDKPAFFIRLRILQDEEELLPVYWSDNYFTLLPQESALLTAELPSPKAAQALAAAVDGWNITPAQSMIDLHSS